MFKKLFFLSFVLILFTGQMQSQALDWLKTINYSFFSIGDGTAVDPSGNVYLAGGFGGHSTGNRGFYIQKYTATGNLLWADTSGPAFNVVSAGVVCDAIGNAYTSIFVAGVTGSIKIGNTVYPGGNTMYIIKYNSVGQLQWVVNQGNNSHPWAMAIGPANNLYVTGNGAGGVGFVSIYNGSGNQLKYFPMSKAYDIALDAAGNFYVMHNSFVAKYNSFGGQLWSYPGSGRISCDSIGNCYVTNDPNYFGQTTLMKINPLGQHLWTINSVNGENGQAVLADNKGNVYTSGKNPAGMGITKYDTNGNQLWLYMEPNPTTGPWYSLYSFLPMCISLHQSDLYISGIKHKQNSDAFLLKLIEPIVASIKDTKKESFLTISPNPSGSIFNVAYKSETHNSITLKVCDATGKCVYSTIHKNFTGELNETIDLSSFAKGIYILEVVGTRTKETKKLVLQ